MTRDNFTQQTKDILAKRVGYYCSFPKCKRLTVASCQQNTGKSNSIGVACHITAAALGGKRYNHLLSPHFRKHIDNGIWMCQTCSNLIDKDEEKYTVAILKSWKNNAEKIATIMLERGISYENATKFLDVVKLKFNIKNTEKDITDISIIIGERLDTSCLHGVLGNNIVDAIRDFIVEYSINSFTHGKATYLSMEITDNSIILINDGDDYNPNNLLKGEKKGNGGRLSIVELERVSKDYLYLGHEREDNTNKVILSILHPNVNLNEISDCCIVVDYSIFPSVTDFNIGMLTIKETCSEIFIVLPNFTCFSYVSRIAEQIPSKIKDKEIVFVCDKISEGVISHIRNVCPEIRIIRKMEKFL